jgi:hypothetical protein
VWYSSEPFHCGGRGGTQAAAAAAGVTFWQIYRKVWLTAVLWGAGTAVGEVPPYFLSYQAAVAGTRNDMLQDVQENMHTGEGRHSHTRPLNSTSSPLLHCSPALHCTPQTNANPLT